jgi:mannose-6-phosphate isomerase-like protein (cupin superfamily)
MDMSTVDTNAVLEGWRARGFDGGMWVDPPGKLWRDFVHDDDELLMLVEGQLALEIAGRQLTPAIGQEITIPAGATHTVHNVGRTTARWLYAYRRA